MSLGHISDGPSGTRLTAAADKDVPIWDAALQLWNTGSVASALLDPAQSPKMLYDNAGAIGYADMEWLAAGPGSPVGHVPAGSGLALGDNAPTSGWLRLTNFGDGGVQGITTRNTGDTQTMSLMTLLDTDTLALGDALYLAQMNFNVHLQTASGTVQALEQGGSADDLRWRATNTDHVWFLDAAGDGGSLSLRSGQKADSTQATTAGNISLEAADNLGTNNPFAWVGGSITQLCGNANGVGGGGSWQGGSWSAAAGDANNGTGGNLQLKYGDGATPGLGELRGTPGIHYQWSDLGGPLVHGWFGVPLVAQQTDVGAATDNTTGTPSGTLTFAATADANANNNWATFLVMYAAIRTIWRNYGLWT